ncbi:conserved hypothetical protein [Theileria orientalis strain Shintoku]|uniref:Uncharacterized protein n=1 Tax=Theileria orientalis strain Shintoku TaxID=869250 RepID=J4D9I0_THEOR|nr:conserved hypothetical protein [Theileria orientalis strain Shintoku]BAM41395.1 conserved hypothetical protein [Theileria orientalis strain Shintoku]|eukprot:XP_009691696.1 conserved hypothetical protein [Theileria orientalis strain Shintoku]
MSLIAVILGIYINLGCVALSTGVIDISDPKSRELFSGPTKIGNAHFYKYTCNDDGSYSNVFDKNFQIFPLRAHTRLVNIVLACKEKDAELLQLMYCDVKKDLRLNNLYYRKSEEAWNLIDQATYKSELSNLKNNYVSFQLNEEEHVGFKKVKSAEEDGYDSYVLEEEYEMDKVYENKLVVWESDPNYTFKSLDLAKTKDGTEQLRIQFSNYCSEVSQFYKVSAGRWVLDIGTRRVDLRSLYTHGSERNEGHGRTKEEEASDAEYMGSVLKEYDEDNEYEDPVTISASDLCDVEMGFGEVEFNVSFTKGSNPEMTVRHYTTYEISNYEFLTLRGARLNWVRDGEWQILDREEDDQWFYNAKLAFVPEHDVATVALTTIRMKEGACDEETKKCKLAPFSFKHFFHKKKATVWSCLEQFPYYYEMNTLVEVASQLTMKRMYESPPVTPTHVPSTMYLDYGGKVPFTYEINNPFENRLTQDLLHTDPDFIRLRPKEGTVMNAVVDGASLLWEQKEAGNGVLMIYVYKSENNLVAHLVVDSATEPHLFIKQHRGRWHFIDKEEYESLKDAPMVPKKAGLFKKQETQVKVVDEYSLDPDSELEVAPEAADSDSGSPSDPPAPGSADAEGDSAAAEAKAEASEKPSEYDDFYISDSRAGDSHQRAKCPFGHGSTDTADSHHNTANDSHNNNDTHNSHHSAHNQSQKYPRNAVSAFTTDFMFDTDDEFEPPKRPVKIKRSSIKNQAPRKSVTIDISDDSEDERGPGSPAADEEEL